MNNRIFFKIVDCTHRLNLCRFLSSHQNVNKTSISYTIDNFYNKREKCSSHFSFSYYCHKKLLNYAHPPLYMNFQVRHLSSETNIKDVEKFLSSQTPDLSPAEEAAKIASSHVPELLKNMSEWKIVELAQTTLVQVHEFTGLPWWATIVLTAIFARATVTFPFSVLSIRNTAKLQQIPTQMEDVVEKLKKEANYAVRFHHWPESLAKQKYQQALRKEWNQLVIKHNCHPAKSYILILMQIPLWFSFSLATRNLCYMLPRADINAQITYMELTVGGFGWITNLANIDQYFILPFSLALINLTLLEVHRLFSSAPPTKFDKWKTYAFRGISIILIPIAANMPSATLIYWLTSSLFGLTQAFLLNSITVRQFLKVPITKHSEKDPYRVFFNNLNTKLRIKND